MKEIFKDVWREGKRLYTKNLVAGDRTYTRKLVKFNNIELREWDPHRSKPAAAIVKGLSHFPLTDGMKVLYLGLANGQTATFFSDIVGRKGIIYGVEISERTLRDVIPIANLRKNIVPILGDARKPEEYGWIEEVDIVYEDVASDDQTPILLRNCERFLRKGGYAMIAIKARSIDVVKRPDEIYRDELKKLKNDFEIVQKVKLDPFEKDHMFVVLRKRN